MYLLIDIDECSLGTDDCEQECVNIEGNYTCQCFPNYRLINTTNCEGMHEYVRFIIYEVSRPMHSLADIDECLVLNGGCHQVCTNTQGSHFCSCNQGYQLEENNSTCIGIQFLSLSLLCLIIL